MHNPYDYHDDDPQRDQDPTGFYVCLVLGLAAALLLGYAIGWR